VLHTTDFIISRVMMLLNIPFVPNSLKEFFSAKINSTIEYREKEKKSRADMIQLLLDARTANPSKCKLFRKKQSDANHFVIF
jgi:hypothetical protein